MANITKSSMGINALNLIASLVGACVLLCLAALYFDGDSRPDPVSPPETQLGTVPSFDAILGNANRNWRFLFKTNNQIVITDIYGQNDSLVLNSALGTHRESLSPDGKTLAVNYQSDLSAYSQSPFSNLVIIDLQTGTVTQFPTDLDGFEFDWTTPVHWLSPTVFLATMHRYVGDDMFSEDVALLRFDVDDLHSVQIIEFEPCSLTRISENISHVLLLKSDCEPINGGTTWAIDTEGKRLASPGEVEFFNLYYSSRFQEQLCFQDQGCTNENGTTVRTEPVVDALDCFTRYCENNLFRDYVYLNDRLVRITDGSDSGPKWDSEVGLFVWGEADYTYYMDDFGHYRPWHLGVFLDKVPVSILSDEQLDTTSP
jgi:hypothetical protein